MKHLRMICGALLLALFALLSAYSPALATVDGGVCSSSDTGGTGCTFTQLKPNLNEEVNNLNGRASLPLASVTGTDTITACTTPAITSYVDRQPLSLKPAADNTGAVTLNVCSIAAKALTDSAGNALTSGNLRSSTIYNVVYFAANDQFRVLSPLSGSGVGLTSLDIDTSSELDAIVTDDTGSGAMVFANSPTLVTPALGTPASGTLTNATGLPIATGVSGLGSGVATVLATPSSANLATALTNETGTGAAVFGTTPTFTTSMVAMGDTISDFTGFGMALSSGALGLSTTGALNGECLSYNSTGPAIDWITCGGGGGLSYGTTVTSTGTTDALIMQSTDSGASAFNGLVIDRDSSSPAANDIVGRIVFRGNHSGLSDNDYGRIATTIIDPTGGIAYSRMSLYTMRASALDETLRLENDSIAVGGLITQGSGSVNASSYFDDSVNINTLYQGIDSDLTALAGTASTGLYAITGTGTSAVRTLTAPAAGITVSNGNGVSGNPTLALANDLAAVEGLGSTGIAVRTGSDTWAQRSVAGTANEISVANSDGVSGNPTISLPSAITATGKTITGGTFSGPTISSSPVITLSSSAAPVPTVEGRVEWDSDDDRLILGDGAGQVHLVPASKMSGDATQTNAGVIEVTQADALESNGANCSAGQYPLGIDTAGAVESCTADDDVPDAGEVNDTALAAGAVDGGPAGEIADGSVTADDLGTDSVASDEIAANAVANAEMADNAIGLAEMADDAIGIDEMDLITGNVPSNGDCLTVVPGGTGGTIESVTCPGAAGGDDVVVNAGAVSNPDLNDTTPAAPTLGKNVYWQASGGSVSAYVKPSDWRTVVALASDYNTSSTTLSAVTGMTCAMDASATYEVTVIGTFQSAAITTGIGMALDIPSGDVVGTAQTILAATTASFSHQNADNAVIGVTTAVPVANTNYPVIGKWLVSTAGTSGTMQLQYRAEVAASTTLKAAASGVAGTVMTCERII